MGLSSCKMMAYLFKPLPVSRAKTTVSFQWIEFRFEQNTGSTLYHFGPTSPTIPGSERDGEGQQIRSRYNTLWLVEGLQLQGRMGDTHETLVELRRVDIVVIQRDVLDRQIELSP
eukprot:scaffold13351_cov200-Amphora_coffeaeformis.AAC.1